MNKQIAELKHKRAGLITDATNLLNAGDKANYDLKMAEIKKINANITDLEDLDAEAGRFGDEDAGMASRAEVLRNQHDDKALESALDTARAGKEYARAFAYALQNGISPKKASRDENVKPLINALTIAGGSPAGTDGGFLVPVDMDNMIMEVKRQLKPLSALFDVQTVSTSTGWRAKDTAPTTGFTKLDGELPAGGIAADDQPVFAKISYSLDTYGLYIPMSKELIEDEVANLLSYLSRWLGKKEVITENILLIALLTALTETDLTAGSELAGIKAVLNKSLDPAISANAKIITNQSGLNLLDSLEDLNGRPLMQPDITNPTVFNIKGRPITPIVDAMLPNTGSASPAAKAPIYIGDFEQFGTLFRRKALEISGTDVGGDAWRKNGYEVRAITRLDAVTFDSDAAKGVNFIH